jgi:hypothetical protein
MEKATAAITEIVHACKSLPAPAPTQSVDVKQIQVPEYFIGDIPGHLKPVYEVLGIQFVCVRKAGVDHYVLSTCLECVVKRLSLYV